MMDAVRNRNYYLREQKALKNEPWFRLVRSIEPYSEEISITPNMARELLSHQKMNFSKVPKLVSSDILISYFGKLIDGKDKLESIVSENRSRKFVVHFNVTEKFIFDGR